MEDNKNFNTHAFGEPDKLQGINQLNTFQELIAEAKAKKEDKTQVVTDKEHDFNTTKEINLFNDPVFSNIDEIKNDTFIEEKEEEEETVSIESVFISCAILGFVTMFIVFGIFYYIMYHI